MSMESPKTFHRMASRWAGAASGGRRGPILIAALGLALLIVGAVAYFYADEVIELVSSLASGRAIHAQGHIRY
jgi:predicted ribosomally synthesized peptide with SipW-like signal peptide